MIVVIGGIKGGTGKTTVATNMVVIETARGKRVLLIDADEQGSATDLGNQRERTDIPTAWVTIRLSGVAVGTQCKKMEPDYDEVIIDTGGRDTSSQRAALTIADLFLAPFQPRSLDIWTLDRLLQLVSEAQAVNPKLKAFGIINRADIAGKDTDGAKEIIDETPTISCLPVSLLQRKAFSNATAEGLGVTELTPINEKAISEAVCLNDAIFMQKICQTD